MAETIPIQLTIPAASARFIERFGITCTYVQKNPPKNITVFNADLGPSGGILKDKLESDELGQFPSNVQVSFVVEYTEEGGWDTWSPPELSIPVANTGIQWSLPFRHPNGVSLKLILNFNGVDASQDYLTIQYVPLAKAAKNAGQVLRFVGKDFVSIRRDQEIVYMPHPVAPDGLNLLILGVKQQWEIKQFQKSYPAETKQLILGLSPLQSSGEQPFAKQHWYEIQEMGPK